MSKKFTIEEMEARQPHLVKGQSARGTHEKYWYICRVGHDNYQQRFTNHHQGKRCPQCSGNQCLTIAQAETQYPDMCKGQLYSNSLAKYWFWCTEHGKYLQKFGDHSKQGCPDCGHLRNSKAHLLTIEEAESRHPDMCKGQAWSGNQSNYRYSCKRPGHDEYLQQFNNHDRGSGCPVCCESHGEKKVAEVLQMLNVEVDREFSLPDCRDKLPLRFDFCVWGKDGFPRFIEFNGQQHYNGWKKHPESLESIQRRDSIKVAFCKRIGIPLLVIPYGEPDVEQSVRSFVEG